MASRLSTVLAHLSSSSPSASTTAAATAGTTTSSSPPPSAPFTLSLQPGSLKTTHSVNDGERTLVVQWNGYHTIACSWGYTRAAVDQPLFLGFTDGAANIMVVRLCIYSRLEDTCNLLTAGACLTEQQHPLPSVCTRVVSSRSTHLLTRV